MTFYDFLISYILQTTDYVITDLRQVLLTLTNNQQNASLRNYKWHQPTRTNKSFPNNSSFNNQIKLELIEK